MRRGHPASNDEHPQDLSGYLEEHARLNHPRQANPSRNSVMGETQQGAIKADSNLPNNPPIRRLHGSHSDTSAASPFLSVHTPSIDTASSPWTALNLAASRSKSVTMDGGIAGSCPEPSSPLSNHQARLLDEEGNPFTNSAKSRMIPSSYNQAFTAYRDGGRVVSGHTGGVPSSLGSGMNASNSRYRRGMYSRMDHFDADEDDEDDDDSQFFSSMIRMRRASLSRNGGTMGNPGGENIGATRTGTDDLMTSGRRTPQPLRHNRSTLSIQVGSVDDGNRLSRSQSLTGRNERGDMDTSSPKSTESFRNARRESNAMMMDADVGARSHDSMAVDGFAAPSRRKSVSGASTKSLNRIAALLKEEAKPFDKEIAHEKAVNQSLPHLSGSLSLGSFDSMLNDDEMEELDEIVGEDTEYDRLQGMSPSRRASISARQQVGNRGMPSGSSRPSTAPSSLPNVPTTPRTDRSMVLPMPDTDRLQSRESTPETFAAAGQPVTPGGSGAAVVPVAVRAVAIPNSALKDPATYVSHSSRLNPENSFLSKQYEMMLSSPSLSPVHTIHGSASPSGSERKGKRKLSVSGDTDRFEPYMKKVHRMPSSPTIHSPTFNMSHNFPMSLGSSGSNSSSHQPYRMATPPPPISLPYPLVFQRQRSPSVSSQSSGTGSMWGVERTTAAAGSLPAVMSHNRSSTPSFNSNQNTTSASASAMMVSNTPPPSSSLGTPPTQSHHLSHLAAVQGLAVPPPSPRSLGQMLNLTGTQEGFTKMSITE